MGDPIVLAVQLGLDMPAINSRFGVFRSSSSCKPYQRQKLSLEQQLSSFLASLSPLKSIPSATSEDIVKFVISEDGTGRTIVYTRVCDRKACECPRRLAASSVDSPIRTLRAIYNNLGRFAHTNLVPHLLIKEYLKFVREEQANLAIVLKQAGPLFFEKFNKSLVSHFRKKIAASAPLSLVSKYTSSSAPPPFLSWISSLGIECWI